MRAISFDQFLVSADIGGAGLVALNIAADLRRRDQACFVWIPGDGPAMSEARGMRLAVRRYNATRTYSPSRIQAAIANLLVCRTLRGRQAGLVHVHSPHCYGALRGALKFSGLKTVVHVQLEESLTGLRWAFKQPPDLIITCSRSLVEHVRGALPDQYQDEQRIEPIPNAVDTERFRPHERGSARVRGGVPAGVPVILMLANLSPHKGQETTIRAIAELKARGVDVVCLIAGAERGGKSEYTSRLQALIGTLGVQDRIRLLGHRSDAPDLLRAADVFVLPSTCEGLPLSVLEAQAAKVPVIAAPTAGVPEVVEHGETGFLAAAGDAGAYARHIEVLLHNPMLYRHVADRAYLRVTTEYSWSAFCGRVWQVYGEVMKCEAGRGSRRC